MLSAGCRMTIGALTTILPLNPVPACLPGCTVPGCPQLRIMALGGGSAAQVPEPAGVQRFVPLSRTANLMRGVPPWPDPPNSTLPSAKESKQSNLLPPLRPTPRRATPGVATVSELNDCLGRFISSRRGDAPYCSPPPAHRAHQVRARSVGLLPLAV